MIAMLLGGPHDGLMITVDKHTRELTDDGELRLPVSTGEEDPTEFAIYSQVLTEGQEPDARHMRGAYRFSRFWTRPEELTT